MKTSNISPSVLFCFCLVSVLRGQEQSPVHSLEISGGISAAVYQSVFSFQPGFAVETAVRGNIQSVWYWQTGARLEFHRTLPEVFFRALACPEIDSWRPEIGLEFGYTERAQFDAGGQLLQETRQAAQTGISPFYIAVHAAPLSFRLGDDWRVSLLELQFGTHTSHLGRTLRAQIGLLSLGAEI